MFCDLQMTKSNKRGQKRRGRMARGKITGFLAGRGLFPDTYLGEMTYGRTFTFPTAALTMVLTTLRLNSIYDPDFSGAGTSAAGYAEASAIYGRYRVYEVIVDLDSGIDSGNSMQFLACASCDNTLGTDPNRVLAQRHAYAAAVMPGGTSVSRRLVIPIHRLYGVPKQQVIDEDDYAAPMGANPNNQVFLHVGFWNPGATSTTGFVGIRMTFKVRLSLPLMMSQL